MAQKYIDFRSDTVTNPTPSMRQAMFTAEVGDDFYNDDPTAIKLQNYAAKIFNKDSSLFVPTGCFGNTCSLLSQSNRGDELILASESHIVLNERGSAAALSQIQLRTIDTSKTGGLMSIEDITKAIRKSPSLTQPKTALICIEQPTFFGRVYPLSHLKQIYYLAKQHNINVHMDGARLFNASSYLKCDPADITQYCDTLQICLSKGLCAPVGSIIAGSQIFIQKATENRKMLGGGMRQVGVIAAPGLVALQEQVGLLGKDREMAILVAEKMKKMKFVSVLEEEICINMLFFKFTNDKIIPGEFLKFLLERNIKVSGPTEGLYRIMTHFYINEEEVEQLIRCLEEFLVNFE